MKWRDEPFGTRDLHDLASHARSVPGAEQAELVAVTRKAPPERLEGLATCWGPEDIIGAWET